MAKRLAKKIFTTRAAQRRSGEYVCPEEDAEEPARTEQALAFASLRACFRLPTSRETGAHSAGLSLDMLAAFLGDGNPTRRGVFHACIGLFLGCGDACIFCTIRLMCGGLRASSSDCVPTAMKSSP